ncbi:cupin domain-containing protein [Streptomyces roseochromogenus]|uniref:cupin domain-containing protein n=1 Tax=Streptomyces roseochromogenus TaxID=285450 RepID=UPI001FD83575|nr:cupin domain-containing protein [Streptomyces roseochromogenus]
MTHAQDRAPEDTPLRPPRWKQSLLTFVAIYPMLMAVQEVCGTELAHLPVPLRTLVIVAVVAPLANYLVFPVLIRLAGRFLRPWPRPPARPPAAHADYERDIWMTKDRFFLLDEGASRATRVPLPPRTTVKAGVEDTQGRFSLIENHGDCGLPSHVQDTFDHFVYVIDGEIGVELDGTAHRLTSGMSAMLPRGVTHTLQSLGADDSAVHTLHLWTPGGWERHLEDIAEAGAGHDWKRANELGGRYGVRYHLADGGPDDWGDKLRFFVLDRGEARPGRIATPPAFSVKARTADTDGLFSLLQVTVAQPIPRHTHHVADECIYVLDGELDIEYDGAVHTAGRGQFVLLPHGIPHALRPGSNPPPRVIQISSPGGWECVVEALIEHRSEVSTAGRFDPAALNRFTRRYHVVYEETRAGVGRGVGGGL